MLCSEVIRSIDCEVLGNSNIEISNLACDTSQVTENCMFFCLSGEKNDGHAFALKAVCKGAVAIVVNRFLPIEITQIKVNNVRLVMSLIAKTFNENAVDKLKIISVVGTNGKTSTAYIIDSLLKFTGKKTAMIGTNGIWIDNKYIETDLTTPDPIKLHMIFRAAYEAKVEYVTMEVSAHAIFHDKMEGIRSDIAVFTNLSQDHLDFFGNMENYANVKKKFFTPKYTKVSVVNADDSLGREIIQEEKTPTLSYGYVNPCDVFAIDYLDTPQGSQYVINLYDEVKIIDYQLHGKFNMYNTLSACCVLRLLGIKVDTIAQGIGKIKQIDGRNQVQYKKNGAKIVVDFAHTPDGIDNILSYLRNTTKGRLITVFGCGGNRDSFKRPLMGKSVSEYSDYVIITNDNPRYESPNAIISDIIFGVTKPYAVVENRKEAIIKAIDMAQEFDTVAILGKGAEKFQEVKGVRYKLCDIEIVKGYVKN